MRKKENSAVSERRLEKTIAVDLLEVLETQLETYDEIEVEVDIQNVPIFLKVCESLSDYTYEQVSDTLFRFKAKEFEW